MFEFTKMHASGNDFIILDERRKKFQKKSHLAKILCRRKFGIGADGVLFISGDKKLPRFEIYNSDGSHPKMCGNGARCAALWIKRNFKIKKKNFPIRTDSGIIFVKFQDRDFIEVEMPSPRGKKENILIPENKIRGDFVIVGVPHFVHFVEDVRKVPLEKIAPGIRFSKIFPQGANVNFVEVVNRRKIKIRTYERGVEEETFSCGTGSSASVWFAYKKGLVENKVDVITSGGEILKITVCGNKIYLAGKSVFVFEGKIQF